MPFVVEYMDRQYNQGHYPHNDTTWPNTTKIVNRMVTEAGLDEAETCQLLRGNAIECYGLERYALKP